MDIPAFNTDRLILRGVTIADAPSYQKYFVDYEVIRHLNKGVPWPYPDDGVACYIRDVILPSQGKDKWSWGIFLKENPGEMIGGIDLIRVGCPENRGFWLGRPFWGRGLMTEAVMPVMDFAFDVAGFDKMTLANALDNARSGRIKEKTGARLVRVEPGLFVDPAVTQRQIWEITRDEWRAFRAGQSGVLPVAPRP